MLPFWGKSKLRSGLPVMVLALAASQRAEGREERHVGPVSWKGEGRGKPNVTGSLGRCVENRLLKGHV